jgi:hypothetical protein
MAQTTSFYTLATDVSNNFFSGIWKLTRCMKNSGWVYKGSSNGSTKDTSGTSSSDLWGGNANPTLDAYPTALSSVVAWWVAQGPQILKIPIAVAGPATGVFVRGEAVSQATSAATGECLGYVYDGTNGGWMVVAPRTGTWDNSHLITGAVSGATVTPGTNSQTSAVKVMTQEVAFIKDTSAQQGWIYWVVGDASTDSAALLSTLITSAGCTAVVGPGQGGTSNAFPTLVIAIQGGNSTSNQTYWCSSNTATAHCLISATNATIGAGVSADGTAWVLFNDTNNATTYTYLTGIFRVDDGEQGDCSPFVWVFQTSSLGNAYTRTNNPSGGPTTINYLTGDPYYGIQGYIARGTGTIGTQPDVTTFYGAIIPYTQLYALGSTNAFSQNTASQVRVYNHPSATKPLAVDTVQIFNNVTNQQQLKGRLRWMRWAGNAGTVYDTTDGKTWVVWIAASSTTNPSITIGPWDGSTTPAT